MHIHKPEDVLLLLCHACRAGQPLLTVTVGYVCATDGSRLSEQAAWQWLTPLFPDEPFDLGEKKAGGGFGVAGDACAPAGSWVEGLAVRAGVGPLEARLLVQGDRRWTQTAAGWRATAAAPFERQPIGLAYAYGGADWHDNPYGRGHGASDTAEGRLLPNVEHPDHPVLKPGDNPETATLGPQPMGCAARTRWLGAVDDVWARRRLPWLPDDTDPRWFDRFSPQQCRQAYWQGDEAWFAENMHPQHSVLQGRLPGLRPRVLLRTAAEPDRRIELETDLDTVWLMPNDQRVVVLYRAQVPVRREDAKDVLGLAVFTENMAEPPQAAAYWSGVWNDALHDEDAAPLPVPVPLSAEQLAQLETTQAETAQAAAAFQASLEQEVNGALSSARTEADERLRAGGIDIDAMKAQAAKNDMPDVSIEELGELPADPQAYKAKLEAYIDNAFKQAEAEARALLEERGIDPDAMLAHAKANSSADMDTIELIEKAVASLPISDSERQAHITAYTEFMQEMDGLEARIQAQFDEAEQATAAAFAALEKGRYADPAELPTGPRAALTREVLLERAARGESAAWSELQGLDLAGISLAGLDLRGSVLRECDLRGAVLEGADLTDALLENCMLGDAKLNAACLKRAQLDACVLSGGQLNKTDFSDAAIKQCDFGNADLTASCWNGAQVTESGFEAAVLVKAAGQRAGFTQCRLPAIDATESRFEHTDFQQCALDGARFSRAQLSGSTLQACQASHAQFDHANLQGLRTLQDTRLDQANLSAADLQDASLQNTVLTQAVLRETRLDRALVKECDLSGTDAWRMVARQADFADSRIEQASWRGVNLMQATLGYARLQDTDLTGANLHAMQTRTTTTQGLILDGALMTRCRLLQEYGERGHG